MTTLAPSNLLEEIQSKLANGAVSEAGAVIDKLWADFFEDPNLGYLKALYHRLSNQPSQALTLLTELTTRYPDMARAHQEIALNSLSVNEPKAALRAAEFAVALDASLVKAWELLEPLHRTFTPEKLGATQDQIRFLKSLPTELRTVIGYLSAGKLQDAERLCKYFLREHKTHAEGMRLLAEILTRKNILDEAQFILETLHELEPDNLPAAIQLFHVVMRRQRFHSAYEIAQKLRDKYPDDEDQIKKAYAAACFSVGRIDEAEDLYKQLRQQHPNDHLIPISQGHIFNSSGDRAAAIDAFKASSAIKVDHGDAYWSLANTKSYRFDEAQIQQMRELEERQDIGELDQIQICFALGKAYEDADQFEDAFEFYARGNRLKLPSTHFDVEQLIKRIDAQINVCTADLFTQLAETGLNAPDPIFIVGLPRAGSTLLEQILASHSLVDGTMELHNILDLAKRLRGRDAGNEAEPRYPRILGELDTSMFESFGQQFIDQTRVYRSSAPHFIDKMPNNFFHIGLIKLILPNAKVIDARRHPMACCFSGFKQLWGEGQEFSYGLEQIGTYYRQYVRLMTHWDEVLPDFVLRVQHEDVVDDLEGQVRRLLDFCGLPFESACLDYHKTDRTVRTPSAEQVRQPIYRSGLDQWRNFEKHLDPLKAALGEELLETYDIAPPQ
ncbi:MAG: sulfotransferase [Pseudomonadota bacterium]|nr:sulfotransferase [Pseudomonadota bacterium]